MNQIKIWGKRIPEGENTVSYGNSHECGCPIPGPGKRPMWVKQINKGNGTDWDYAILLSYRIRAW